MKKEIYSKKRKKESRYSIKNQRRLKPIASSLFYDTLNVHVCFSIRGSKMKRISQLLFFLLFVCLGPTTTIINFRPPKNKETYSKLRKKKLKTLLKSRASLVQRWVSQAEKERSRGRSKDLLITSKIRIIKIEFFEFFSSSQEYASSLFKLLWILRNWDVELL